MAKEDVYNRWNTPGPFMQDEDLTPEEIEKSDLMMKAMKLANEGDYSLGIEIGIFSESELKKIEKESN